MPKRLLFLLFCLLFGQKILFSQPKWVADSLDVFVERHMAAWQIPGLALAVVQNGEVVLTRTYGKKRADRPEKIDRRTRFMVASNTKAFTGTALAWLDAEKKLSLDDRVVKHLPGFQLWDSTTTRLVTVRDLLCHRLGTMTFQGDMTFWTGRYSREKTIEKMRFLKPKWDFRTRFGYCNSCFTAAGEVIPKVTGQTWEQFIEERFFKNLGMADALALTKGFDRAENTATGHTIQETVLYPLAPVIIDNLAPAGSICASIGDMAKWLLFQIDTGRVAGKEVCPKSAILKTWQAQTIVNPTVPTAYGLGWFIDHFEGRKRLSHTGGADGYVTATAFLPAEKLGCVVLTNTDSNDFYSALQNHLLEAYLGISQGKHAQKALENWQKDQQEEQNRIAVERYKTVHKKGFPELPIEAYAGEFFNELYGKITIQKLNDEALLMHFEHHPTSTSQLDAQGGHDFMMTSANKTFGIHPAKFRVERGLVKAVEIKVNDFVEYESYIFEKRIK